LYNKSDLLHFVKIIGRLKKVRRLGWLLKVGVKNPESVADHSFMTSILCMLIGDLNNLDTLKMVKMALLHDACESIIGDFKANNINNELEKKKLEDKAMILVLSKLPDNIRIFYHRIWNEFQEGLTEEARLVKEIDKLEMIFQAHEYEEEGYDKEILSEFWESARQTINDLRVKVFFRELKQSKSD